MRQTINATQAVRTFSELLNEIKYKGTTYTCHRRVRSLQKWRFKSLQSDLADKEVRSGGYESPQLTGLAFGDAIFV
jgi:hypothetical protein